MQSQYLFRGRSASSLRSHRRKSYPCLGQKEKPSSGSWMVVGFFFYYLLQAGKTHCEGKEEGKKARSRAGGTFGQAASVTQGNGLAALFWPPWLRAACSVLSGTRRVGTEPDCPLCSRWEHRPWGDIVEKEAGGWGWMVLPILSLFWHP